MLFVSFLFVMNPGLRSFVYSNVYGTKRFSAFIQYPNVSALYFLVCLVVFLYEISDYYERQDEISILEKVIPTIFTLIFLAGIFFTGSRYVYLLTIVAFIYIFIEKKNLRRLILVLLCAGGFSGLVFVLLYRKGEGQNISFNAFNYLSDDKSFQTRLFQYEDAIPLILKHPFGQGFGRYYETLPSFQRAMYFIRYIHNGYFSLAFSFGVICAIAFIILLIKNIISCRGMKRLILIIISLHLLFDTAIDFMAIVYIMIGAMEWKDGKRKEIHLVRWNQIAGISISIVAIALSGWLGTADMLSYFYYDKLAARIYPYNYEYLEYSITDADFSEENLSVALNVIKLNDNSDAAYTFLAQYYFSKNDFMTASEYYRKAILSNRYDSQVYLRYKSVLNYEIEVSQNMNDQNMISFCEEELTWVDKRILKIKQETYEKAEELQMTLMI